MNKITGENIDRLYMTFFNSNKFIYSIFLFLIITVAVYFSNYYQKHYLDSNDEYKLIQQYLLNDSPLYGYNKPKLWIHSKYEINARKWKSFQSRNSTDLNQPYLHLTIKTIVNHCSQDFNICLIDDDTFEKLLPNWDIELKGIAEPQKSSLRQLGLLKLVYYYGGMVVPNSFICFRNLKKLYEEGTTGPTAFICENVNKRENLVLDKHHQLFLPDFYFFGATKNSPAIKECIEFVKGKNISIHSTDEPNFLGTMSQFALDLCLQHQMKLIDGEKTGVKTKDRKPILLDHLMEEEYLNLSLTNYGVYIPDAEVLARIHYQWFAVLSKEELSQCTAVIAKYIMISLVDTQDVDKHRGVEKTMKSVVAI